MSEHVAERCPRCGSPLEGRNPYLPSYGRYECGSYERDDTATIECYRRQLAQAQAEVERLRREREVLAEALKAVQERNKHVYTCENCECALCPQGTELSYRAYRALGEAMDLLDGEEIVDNVTHFALYHPDLNAWECQAEGCSFLWEFEDGNPYEDGMRFCPRCGRRIVRRVDADVEGRRD